MACRPAIVADELRRPADVFIDINELKVSIGAIRPIGSPRRPSSLAADRSAARPFPLTNHRTLKTSALEDKIVRTYTIIVASVALGRNGLVGARCRTAIQRTGGRRRGCRQFLVV